MASERTKSLKKKRNLFGALSYVLWIGTAVFLAIYAFCHITTKSDGVEIFSKDVQAILVGVGTTALVAIIGVILIKDKLRIFIWMVSLILSVILFKEIGMYVILGLWLIDEYILTNLFHYYCHKVEINKEIDLRQ